MNDERLAFCHDERLASLPLFTLFARIPFIITNEKVK